MCGVCVESHDHHCMVFDRCIGKGNICLFFMTIAGYMVVLFMAIFLTYLEIGF